MVDEIPALADFEPFGVYCSWEIALRSSTASESAIGEAFEFVEGNCDLEITRGSTVDFGARVPLLEAAAMPSFEDLLGPIDDDELALTADTEADLEVEPMPARTR